MLAALSDPVRMSIMCALSDGRERGWGEFCEPVAKSTLSHHMKVLREAGLIVTRHEGTRCYVRRRDEVDELYPGLVSKVLELADSRCAQRPKEEEPAGLTPAPGRR